MKYRVFLSSFILMAIDPTPHAYSLSVVLRGGAQLGAPTAAGAPKPESMDNHPDSRQEFGIAQGKPVEKVYVFW